MPPVTAASSRDDVAALDAIETHHAELVGQLEVRVDALFQAVRHGDSSRAIAARDALVSWCHEELAPHADAEEESLYPAARGLSGLTALILAMTDEHERLRNLIGQLAAGDDAVSLVADAGALRALFVTHVDKENQRVLPVLATDPTVDLAGLLAQMHEALPEHSTAHAPTGEEERGHHCGCHEHDEVGDPELDARTIPHAVRHATVLGALGSIAPGSAMVLVAPHDPVPLLAQIEERFPAHFEVSYLERGPEAWRLRFARTAA